MPDFFSQLNPANPVENFKEATTLLLDTMLAVPSLTENQRAQIARLRAKVQIDLTDF